MSVTITVERTPPDPVLDRLAATSEARGLPLLAARLHQLGDLVEDLGALGAALAELERTPRDLAARAARYILDTPGKTLRAICVLLASRLGPRGGRPAPIDLALAAELVHAATLLHDDVIDEGTERRGVPAARMVYGNSASILGGDHLLIEALRRVERLGHRELLAELLGVIGEMIAAEAIQLERRGGAALELDPTPAARFATYLQVARGKTASLFRWSLRAGGTAGGLGPSALAALGDAGEALGVAFQLADDLLDLEGSTDALGKSALSDLREGKLTWPLLVALERDPGLAPAMIEAPTSPAALAAIAERIRSTGCGEQTRRFAAEWTDRAIASITQLPESRPRQAFLALVEAALHRTR
jgi:octaprenyl-diphosphate synthase